ncbi:replication protein A 70 kDa DNA-binding subunit B-like [Capsicum annuum]|uniref:replication protein A 70 kDa DNA-binding subunit B-like n=1 Tax=Capsicum annuum TaxID=4072 RepID=UPI001FB10675|nr:replication protein A 70 kDa DNA-binding subunit B-like [Capsicum annuum]
METATFAFGGTKQRKEQRRLKEGFSIVHDIEYRLNISRITPQTKEWTCKVQLIKKARERKSKDGRTGFQIAIAQDETEEQITIILYEDDIDKHQNKLTLFSTYLISTAKVRELLPYGLPVNTIEWVVDRFTVVEQIKEYNTGDPPLLASTRLNTISLANLEQEPRHVEFDVLAVVVSCGAIKFDGIHGNKCRQIVVMDVNMHHYIFTLWEDFAEIDGSELAAQIENHPVILAKRIARFSYAGISLTTRYNSTILTNPVYPQVAELTN